MTCQEKRNEAKHLTRIDIPYNAKYGQELSFTLNHDQQSPAIWFFVIMDCEQNMHKKYKRMPRIDMDIKIVTNDQQQFSYEDQGQIYLHLCLLVVFCLMFGTTVKSYMNFYNENQRMDSPHFMIALSLMSQIGGVIFQFIHLLVYSNNGKGIPALDIFSNISYMISDFILSSLVIMIAQGWTITFQDIDWDNNIEFFLPIGAFLIAVHLVLCALTYVDIDAHHKYHDFEGVQGYVLICLKMIIFFYYLYSVVGFKNTIPQRSRSFYKVFSILGFMFMLSVPFTIIFSYFVHPSMRQFVYNILTHMVNIGTSGIMLQQQISSKSKYSKASLLGGAGILPMDKYN